MGTNMDLSAFANKVKSPFGGEIVYKDECIFCYDSPESANGLLVCMITFYGFCRKHVLYYHNKTSNSIFLQIKQTKQEVKEVKDDGNGEPAPKKPTRLAINVEGGFQSDGGVKYEIEQHVSIVTLPNFTSVPYPDATLPPEIQISAEAILASQSASKSAQAAALAGTWEGDKRVVSKYASSLVQLDNGVKIPPSGWKCERCELRDNLWLNLTSGSILCGRRFWDGSGGNNHALELYKETSYPLAVKLGTITPDGGDVYSYDEDDMVEDPFLPQHLAHFGINIAQMEKSDKSMLELEIDYQSKIGEWSTLQESDCKLEPVYGAGFTGLHNLGNSCYLNSVMQCLFSIPDIQRRYADTADDVFKTFPADPVSNFNVQMCKLGSALLSGNYSHPPPEDSGAAAESEQSAQQQRHQSLQGVRPHMFKLVCGRNHPEFSTNRQQDASEFLSHLITLIERNSDGGVGGSLVTECFKFQYEDRFECLQSHKVNYVYRSDYQLELNIPLNMAVNKDEVAEYEARKKEMEAKGERIDSSELVRPRIPLSSCLNHLIAPQEISDFYSTATHMKGLASKTSRIKSFPDYLIVHVNKYIVGDDWVPRKLDVSIEVSDDPLDLEFMRGPGQLPSELLLDPDTRTSRSTGGNNDDEPAAAAAAAEEEDIDTVIDEQLVQQLSDMGFHIEGCKKAVYFTKSSGIEAAMDWVINHMNDADFTSPLQVRRSTKAGAPGGAAAQTPADEDITIIMSLGFTKEQAITALRATDLDVARAGDWAFSHIDELTAAPSGATGQSEPMDTGEAAAAASGPAAASGSTTHAVVDGPARYKLKAFISHMGSSTLCGHYVCHIRKEGKWFIYNDEKVCQSQKPPRDLAYIYMFEREG